MNLGTILYTWMFGELVGSDEFGNRYYRNSKDIRRLRERRWVMYKGPHEPSTVPPEWHAWIHHTAAQPLTESAAQAPSWQKPHQPNLTGTEQAYYPMPGGPGGSPVGSGAYQPWLPNAPGMTEEGQGEGGNG